MNKPIQITLKDKKLMENPLVQDWLSELEDVFLKEAEQQGYEFIQIERDNDG